MSQIRSDPATKRFPVLFETKGNCCGCSACFSICPVRAITMQPDEEGFPYPKLNEEKCVCCYRCLSVCAFKADQHGRTLENAEKSAGNRIR